MLGKIEVQNGLYHVFTTCLEAAGYAGQVVEVLTINKLHQWLGHVSHEVAQKLVKKGLVTGVKLDEDSKPTFCLSCEWGKAHRKPIAKERVEEQATEIGKEIHSNMWGYAPVETINHKEYFVSFTDNYTCYTKIYLLHTKDKVFESYLQFEAWLKTQFDIPIKKLHSN